MQIFLRGYCGKLNLPWHSCSILAKWHKIHTVPINVRLTHTCCCRVLLLLLFPQLSFAPQGTCLKICALYDSEDIFSLCIDTSKQVERKMMVEMACGSMFTEQPANDLCLLFCDLQKCHNLWISGGLHHLPSVGISWPPPPVSGWTTATLPVV